LFFTSGQINYFLGPVSVLLVVLDAFSSPVTSLERFPACARVLFQSPLSVNFRTCAFWLARSPFIWGCSGNRLPFTPCGYVCVNQFFGSVLTLSRLFHPYPPPPPPESPIGTWLAFISPVFSMQCHPSTSFQYFAHCVFFPLLSSRIHLRSFVFASFVFDFPLLCSLV